MFDMMERRLADLGIETPFKDLNGDKTGVGGRLLSVLWELENKQKRVQELSLRITQITAQLAAKTEELFPSVNPLGELQATGQRLDLACAELHATQATVRMLADLYKDAQ